MKVFDLNKIDKFYFGYEDISRAFGISKASAKVTASRYVKQDYLWLRRGSIMMVIIILVNMMKIECKCSQCFTHFPHFESFTCPS